MRTLRIILLLMLSILCGHEQAFATVQTAVMTTTNVQTTAEQTTIQVEKFKKKNAARGGSLSGGYGQWLMYGLGFILVAWLLSLVSTLLGSLIMVVAVICLAIGVMKFFGIL
jgi:hypothetical protein